MAKSKLITPGLSLDSSCISDCSSSCHSSPKIAGVKPAGSQVLIEMLTAQELANTPITITEKDLKVPMQGYVRAVGPKFKTEDWGYDVGNRVLISGGGVIAPNYDGCHRDRFFMEPTAVKSVIIEE